MVHGIGRTNNTRYSLHLSTELCLSRRLISNMQPSLARNSSAYLW